MIILISCRKEGETPDPSIVDEMYFPAVNSDEWGTASPESVNWNAEAVNNLYDALYQNGTRAFILLKNGRIVLEKYWGKNVTNTAPFDKDTFWYWASAGKTLTAFLIGIAQQDGDLNIDHKTSDYLGNNWSSLAADKEELILIRHQLTMTTGLDYEVADPDCTNPNCLQYKADPGTQWYYHNAPYTLLEKVVSNAVGMSFNEYTDLKIENPIGMIGTWLPLGSNNVYFSTARSAARFGLLLLNKGIWNETTVLGDLDYINALSNSSQTLNPAYGYLTWLNGKSSIVFPGSPTSVNVKLSTSAPDDLFAAVGLNGQFIGVVPSEGLVLVRLGEAPDNASVPVVFHDEMWKKINAVIKKSN
ncbi:serine hydrolase [soil metagenome]